MYAPNYVNDQLSADSVMGYYIQIGTYALEAT